MQDNRENIRLAVGTWINLVKQIFLSQLSPNAAPYLKN